jgi:hypothetical protein
LDKEEEAMDPFEVFAKIAMAILIGIGILILFVLVVTSLGGNVASMVCLLWVFIFFGLKGTKKK